VGGRRRRAARLARRARAATGGDDPRLDGLVCSICPDFDSVNRASRSRSTGWSRSSTCSCGSPIPQKYADASLHDGYLRPLAEHREAMLLALNQADRLDARSEAACRADIARLLDAEGLPGMPVLAVSALTGEGLDGLRGALAQRVAARDAALARLAADVRAAAAPLADGCAGNAPDQVGRRERAQLVAALEEAAGVPGVVGAVAAAHRRRGALATGWPVIRWTRRLRPDPMKRLRLEDRGGGDAADRTSLPPPPPVQLAQAQAASRMLADQMAGQAGEPWPAVLRRAATASEPELADRLERAVATADLGVRRPRWWAAASALQWGLAAVAVVGLLWLLLLVGLGLLRLDDAVPLPEIWGDIPLPTAMLVGGALLGLLLAALFRILVRAGAKRRAAVARRGLHQRIDQVAGPLVVDPVERELEVRRELCTAVKAAGS
jgi:hypothetical protein